MTLIDALVVSLNLDASKFKAGQTQANASLKAIGEGATKTGTDVQKVAQGMAQAFAKVRTELLGLLGLFLAGRSVGGLTRDITNQDAALGRLSRRLGMTTEDLSAWDRAAQSAGAASGEAMGSVATLSAAFEKFRLTGQGGDTFIPYLSRLGVHLANTNGKMKDANEQQLEFARAFQAQDRIDPKATDFLGGQIPGMSQGMIDFLRRGPEFVQARLDKQRQIGLPTRQDAENAQDILTQLGYIDDRAHTFGRHLLNDVSPGITRVLTRLGDWLDRHLPGWYARVDPIIKNFMGALDRLNFDHVAAGIETFGKRVWGAFDALANWQPPAWFAKLLGLDGTAGATSSGSGGREDHSIAGFVASHLGTGTRAQQAMDYFVAQGRTPEQAAGIVGSLQQESGFRPEAGVAENSAHQGIAQWNKERREAIEAHFGKKLASMDYGEQLQAVQYEMTQGMMKAAGDRLGRETTAAGASSSVAHHFEIPVGSDDPDAAAKWAKEEAWRRQYAEAALKAYPGAGKRALDHDGGFWDGFNNRKAELREPGKPWVPGPLPSTLPGVQIPALPDEHWENKPPLAPGSFDAMLKGLREQGLAAQTAAQRWGSSTVHNTAHHDNSSSTTINGPINIHTQAKDAKGIARDIEGALKTRMLAGQANRGLR